MPISLGSAPATSDTAVAPPVSSQLHPRLLSSSGRACVAPAEPSHGEKRPSPPRALSFPGPAWDPAGCGRFSRPRVPEENFGRAGKRSPKIRGLLPPGAAGKRKGWRRAYLVRLLRVCMSQGRAGPRCLRSLCCEAELGAACPSVAVCAQSHCSISALGCAPPSPPSLRARSLARCQPPRRSLERVIFFFFIIIFFLLPLPHLPQSKDQSERQSDSQHHA